MKSTIIIALTTLASSTLIALSLWQLSERNRYTIVTGYSEANIPYLLDSKTGKTWRYFRNFDKEKKEYTTEGFILLYDP